MAYDPFQVVSESRHVNPSMLMIKSTFILMLFMNQLNKSCLYVCMLITSSYIISNWDSIVYCIEPMTDSKKKFNLEKEFWYEF